MIINTGMRTDIPAFYSDWILNRIKEGYVYVRNPYNNKQITKYVLSPKVVDCLAFCTKNPHPLIEHLSEFDEYKQFWFVTITPYGKDIEPNVPDKKQVIEDFKILSKHVGIDSVTLRYDPIFINSEFSVEKHIKAFEKLLRQLEGYTNSCVISFLDLYEKVKRNAPDLKPPTESEQRKLGKALAEIAKKYGIEVYGCSENEFLKEYGINTAGCMSKAVIERAIGNKIKAPQKNTARPICDCVLGNDIGTYNTCIHLCKYCYANENKNLVFENIKNHIKTSPLLIGELEPDDQIIEAKQKSWIKNELDQISFV